MFSFKTLVLLELNSNNKKTCGFEVQPKFAVFVTVFTAPSGGRHAQLNTTHIPQWHFCLPGLSVE